MPAGIRADRAGVVDDERWRRPPGVVESRQCFVAALEDHVNDKPTPALDGMFRLANLAVLPGWALMLFAPRSR